MTNHRGLKDAKPESPTDAVAQDDAQLMNEGRRRFSKAGLLAPIVITLASRPVWGTSGDLGSGGMSGGSGPA